jgi:hypothetical protein
VLFDKKNGAPNASIKVLIGMMVLKEGQGWSDEQLFENCNFNLLIRSALGLFNFNDTVPVPSTYYLFRHNIIAYNQEHSDDLLKKCYSQITKNQAIEFNVGGKKIRMDSKLLGSNIAWYSRYELIHEVIRQFITKKLEHIANTSLSKSEFDLINSIIKETGNKVVYRSTKEEIDTRLIELGRLMYHLINLFDGHECIEYQILKVVFGQQYDIDSKEDTTAKNNDDISAQSIQSPHDTDCTYRNKDDNKVKGYSVNVTETCDESTKKDQPVLNLVTDVEVDKATTADNAFLEQAVEHTREIVVIFE